jgi:hypothetical protein
MTVVCWEYMQLGIQKYESNLLATYQIPLYLWYLSEFHKNIFIVSHVTWS